MGSHSGLLCVIPEDIENVCQMLAISFLVVSLTPAWNEQGLLFDKQDIIIVTGSEYLGLIGL